MADAPSTTSANKKDLFGIRVGKNKSVTLVFNAKSKIYDSLKDELGLVDVGDNVEGDELKVPLQYIPHVKITITYKNSKGKTSTAKLICAPEKFATALAALEKQKYMGFDIKSARVPRRRMYA